MDAFDRRPARGLPDDLDDFIEEDEIDDEVDRQLREELEVAKPGTRMPVLGVEESGLDELIQSPCRLDCCCDSMSENSIMIF